MKDRKQNATVILCTWESGVFDIYVDAEDCREDNDLDSDFDVLAHPAVSVADIIEAYSKYPLAECWSGRAKELLDRVQAERNEV